MNEKIKTVEEIEKIAKRLRKKGKIIVATNGCFDLLHVAHINLFENAKRLGDYLIVLLNSDDSVKRIKGEKRPIIPQDQRAKVISALASVDYVVIFEEDEPLNLMKIIKPHKFVKGWKAMSERKKREKELIESWGGEYIRLELENGFSTTNIIKKIVSLNNSS